MGSASGETDLFEISSGFGTGKVGEGSFSVFGRVREPGADLLSRLGEEDKGGVPAPCSGEAVP